MQGCKWHKPEGCESGAGCPWCLVMPALTVLRKIANHLELVKGAPRQKLSCCSSLLANFFTAACLLAVDPLVPLPSGCR